MPRIVINNGDSGLAVRTALNSMTAEIFSGMIFPSVATFADLPAASTVPDQVWNVTTSTGVWVLGTRRAKGLYKSIAGAWDFRGDYPTTAGDIAFVPAGSIAAVNVQAAIEEVDAEHATIGAITASGLTMATARLLGRTTAATGAVEELTIGAGLVASGGSLAIRPYGQDLVASGTTWTTPANITTATVFKFIIVGGGGGGGSVAAAANSRATGGGSAGVGVLFISGLSPSTAYTVAIGAAGAGGAVGGANTGAAGGDTSITISGTTYTAGGGAGGGATAASNGGAGGTTTNLSTSPSFSIEGQRGGAIGAFATSNVSGFGGSTPFGLGMGGSSRGGESAGLAGTGYGSGGSGASTASATSRAGGDGRQGAIFIEWWG